MIIIYILNTLGIIERFETIINDEMIQKAIWIDLIDPTHKEEQYLEDILKVDIPTRQEMNKNEVLSPFYKNNDIYYMIMTAVCNKNTYYFISTAVTFIFMPCRALITIRYAKPKAFNYFLNKALQGKEKFNSPALILEGLIETFIHNIADILEKTGNDLDNLLFELFERPTLVPKHKKAKISDHYNYVIKEVGKNGNVISKNLESLVSINRMLIFFSQIQRNNDLGNKQAIARFKVLLREIQSLSEYAQFLSQRNSFLLDAILGILNVKQNTIIKVFTVAAAMFMPPTLVASIYGMNFKIMPELNWDLGYPFAIFLMAVSAFVPYLIFKKKGWL